MNATIQPRLEVAAALALSLVLALATFRDGRLLTFDGYHYCELAKQFAVEWPDRFGNHWPFGWPLAGALLARLGLPAYFALVALALASLAMLLAGASRVLTGHPLRGPVLLALAASPILAPQLGGVLTELPFAASLLGLALCLTAWPARGAFWGAVVCAVSALCIRYAGLIALAAIVVWLAAQWRALRTTGRAREAVAAWCVACLVSVGLLGLNLLKTGHLSGAGRGPTPGLSSLPAQLADFGWSLPSALVAGGLRDRIGPYSALGVVIGAACFLAITALCLRAWFRPRSEFSRPLALVALGYCAGMAVLRCIGEFDALHIARTFLPALFPLGLLLVGELAASRTATLLLCAVVLGTGTVAATRGISRQIGGDVHPVLTALRERVRPSDTIAINNHAFALAAYFPQRTRHIWPENAGLLPEHGFLVAAAKPSARDGTGAILEEAWVQACARLVAGGQFTYLVREPAVIALARVPSPPSPAR